LWGYNLLISNENKEIGSMAAKKASLTFEDYLRGIQSLEPDDKIDQMDPIDHKGIDTQQYIRKERKSWN
jgi:hypothetical protein